MNAEDTESGTEGALADLIAVEQRLAVETDAAWRQAAQTVESARADAQARAAEIDTLQEEQLAALRDEIEREQRASLAEILQGADEQIARYQAVGEGALDELARWLVSRLLAEDRHP